MPNLTCENCGKKASGIYEVSLGPIQKVRKILCANCAVSPKLFANVPVKLIEILDKPSIHC